MVKNRTQRAFLLVFLATAVALVWLFGRERSIPVLHGRVEPELGWTSGHRLILPIRDSHHAFLFADIERNLLVLVCTDEGFEPSTLATGDKDQATVFPDTPYETTITGEPDRMVFGGSCVGESRAIPAGFAREQFFKIHKHKSVGFYLQLKTACATMPGIESGVLRVVPRHNAMDARVPARQIWDRLQRTRARQIRSGGI